MEITLQEKAGFTVLQINGHLDTGTAPEAEKAIQEQLAQGNNKLAVDFTQLSYISSAGLRVLLSTAKKVKAGQGELKLFGMNEVVKEVFDISGFTAIFNIFDNEETAFPG